MRAAPTTAAPRRAPLGLRMPAASIPRATPAPIEWEPWLVVTRSNGFHVSREASDGTRREFLQNEVGRLRVFRSGATAIKACEQANFTAKAERLSREPLLGGMGGVA